MVNNLRRNKKGAMLAFLSIKRWKMGVVGFYGVWCVGCCFLRMCAARLPERLCQTEKMAPGMAAIG